MSIIRTNRGDCEPIVQLEGKDELHHAVEELAQTFREVPGVSEAYARF